MSSAPTVLLLGVREQLAAPLAAAFGKSASVISLAGAQLTLVDCDLQVSRTGRVEGQVRFGSVTIDASSQVLAGSFCDALIGQLPLDTNDEFERQVLYAERAAFLAFVRGLFRKNLNPPSNGSIYAHAGSLPEQWALMSSRGSLATPEWSFMATGFNTEARTVAIDPFHLAAPSAATSAGYLSIRRPAGIACTRVFAPGYRQDFRVLAGGIETFSPPDLVQDALEEGLQLLKDNRGIDVGEFCYYFAGDIVFWSISPFLPHYAIHGERAVPIAAAIARSLHE